MKVLVLGGKLQGVEISYLAQKAGWDVTVVDKNNHALASHLCKHFVCADVFELESAFFSKFDLVYPALEDIDILRYVADLSKKADVPFVFDEDAYLLSCSKLRSNAFLKSISVTIPPLPEEESDLHEGLEPSAYIVKPDTGSSSQGVRVFDGRSSALEHAAMNPDCFVQSFLSGPIYSIEVVCRQNEICSYVVTEVCVNEDYDCHRILVSSALSTNISCEIAEIGQMIGRALDMRGIFDVEMVLHGSRLYVIEIDARMPSQTPMAIYHATGINLVVEAALGFITDVAKKKALSEARPLLELRLLSGESDVSQERVFARCLTASPQTAPLLSNIVQDTHDIQEEYSQTIFVPLQNRQCVILQHIRIDPSLGDYEFIGEGRLAESPPLKKPQGFHATECVLLGRDGEQGQIYASLIVAGDTEEETERKLNEAIEGLREKVMSYD